MRKREPNDAAISGRETMLPSPKEMDGSGLRMSDVSMVFSAQGSGFQSNGSSKSVGQ